MYIGIILSIAALIIGLSLILFKNKADKSFNKFLKIVVIIFCAIGFLRFFLSDSFVYVINGGSLYGVYYEKTDILQTILRWGYYINYAVLPMALFFNSRLFKNIASYICLPFSLLSTVFFTDYMGYFLSPQGPGLHLVDWFRYAFFIIELVLAISIPIMMQIRHKHYFNVKDKKEWRNFLLALPCIFIIMMPVYVPQSIIGYSSMLAKIGSPFHIIWIVSSLVLTLALYFIFRFTEYRTRFMLCVFLSIVLFFNYSSIFLMGITLPRLPIQLCNLAAYIYILAIPFRMKRLFQFSYLANITGAIIAFVASDFTGGALGFWNMHFVYEHTLVLIIPALAMALRIFPRIDIKALKYTAIGFSIYFVFCLTIGTLINGFSDITGTTVNYFFMFDLDKAFSYFPFLRFAENYPLSFGRFEFYPIIVLLIFVAFSLFYVLFYFLTKFLYKYDDDQFALRNSAIDLFEKKTKKKLKIPREFRKDEY